MVKRWIDKVLLVVPTVALFWSVSFAGQNVTSTVVWLQPPEPNLPCVWFQLSGVAQADPVNPNNPWFAIPTTQTGYNEIYALLLAAKISGSQVDVVTTGAVAGGACGSYAGVLAVYLP